MIVAGEASGDLHGGALAEALFKIHPHAHIIGFGGTAMRAAGVDIRFDINRLGIVGLTEVLFHLKSVLLAYRLALALLDDAIDLLVLIDFPDFNLRLAKAAKQRGLPVVYYVSPQVWAWRRGRIKTISERIDRMLVILPFEKTIYQNAGISCEFVGHPLMDEFVRLGMEIPDPRQNRKDASTRSFLKEKGLDPSTVTIALLPGSRSREVTSLLPVMLKGIERLAKRIEKVQVVISVAPTVAEGLIHRLCSTSPLRIGIAKGNVYPVFQASDAAVVASGTASLQGALSVTPMIIVYKVSWLTYGLARWLVKIKSIALVNIVAEQPCIPELIQGKVSADAICNEIERLIKDAGYREKMKLALRKVADRLGAAGASERAARAICRLLYDGPQNAPQRVRSRGETA